MSAEFRARLLEHLESKWMQFPEAVNLLPPDERTSFLQKQGYARLADLLAHVAAWWQEALRDIPLKAANAAYPFRDYDVDAFNAEAVRNAAGLDETQMRARFEHTLRELVDLVVQLPDQSLCDASIRKRLTIEIIGHYREHALS